MRYLIMDTMLDVSTVFLLGLIATWMLHSCWAVFVSWWREGKEEIQPEEIEHDDPLVGHITTWEKKP